MQGSQGDGAGQQSQAAWHPGHAVKPGGPGFGCLGVGACVRTRQDLQALAGEAAMAAPLALFGSRKLCVRQGRSQGCTHNLVHQAQQVVVHRPARGAAQQPLHLAHHGPCTPQHQRLG